MRRLLALDCVSCDRSSGTRRSGRPLAQGANAGQRLRDGRESLHQIIRVSNLDARARDFSSCGTVAVARLGRWASICSPAR